MFLCQEPRTKAKGHDKRCCCHSGSYKGFPSLRQEQDEDKISVSSDMLSQQHSQSLRIREHQVVLKDSHLLQCQVFESQNWSREALLEQESQHLQFNHGSSLVLILGGALSVPSSPLKVGVTVRMAGMWRCFCRSILHCPQQYSFY